MHDLCSICEYEFLFQIMTSYGCFLLALAVDQGIFSIQKQASFFGASCCHYHLFILKWHTRMIN